MSDVISELTVDGETSEHVDELNDEVKMDDYVRYNFYKCYGSVSKLKETFELGYALSVVWCSGIGFIAIVGDHTGIILEEVKYSYYFYGMYYFEWNIGSTFNIENILSLNIGYCCIMLPCLRGGSNTQTPGLYCVINSEWENYTNTKSFEKVSRQLK